MGTSASGTGPIGRTPLLPSWANGGETSSNPDTDKDEGSSSQDSKENNDSDEPEPKKSTPDQNIASNSGFANSLQGAKSSLKRVANSKKGATLRKAARSYVKSTGGHFNATKASSTGISAGGGYIDFWSEVSKKGLRTTLIEYDLSDCIGKSSEEVFAKIADKIAPIGSTNDEAVARGAIMMAFDRLCERMIENGQDLAKLDKIDNEILKETVIEFVSAYIFKKWVYEAGLALERNDLSESEAIELEKEMRVFIKDEVKRSLEKTDILTLDLSESDGKEIVKNIFDLAYSTLEK